MKKEISGFKTGRIKRASIVVKSKDYDILLAHLREIGKPFSVWVRERIDAYLRRHNLRNNTQ